MESTPPAPAVPRDALIATLAEALESEPWILAAWLGGSDANGRTDAYSDVDLQVIVEDDRIEAAFGVVERAMEKLTPIAIRHRLPEPTWHGHSQAFYQLRDASPHHFVDFVAMKRSAEDRLLEPERHGTPLVLFDRDRWLAPAPFDRAAHARKLRDRLASLRETFPMFQTLTVRAVERGFGAEAIHWFHGMGLRPLVELLRMRHCPDRFDFGLRHLDRDLPSSVRTEVEALAYPVDARALLAYRERIEARFRRELSDLEAGKWHLPPTGEDADAGA